MNKNFKQTKLCETPEGWDIQAIADLPIEIIDGDRGLNYPKKDEFKKQGFCLFLSTKNVPGEHFDFTEADFINEERDRLLRKGKLKKEDIVLTTRGTVGNIAYYHEQIPYEHIRINSGMVIIRNMGDKFDTGYLCHLLKSPIVKQQYLSFATGSAQPQLPIRDINKIRLTVPSILEQRAIAKILSDLDDKIELNHRMNKTLESIVQATFKRWFVDFEFPDEHGNPYKTSGGKMTDSDLDEIPDGWTVKEISDCGEIVCGKTPPTVDKDNYGNDLFFITIPDMRGQAFVIKTERKLSKKGASTQNKKELPALTICVSCIATPGLVSLTSAPSHTNQQINSIVCNKNISPFFMYYTMLYKSEEIKTMGLGGTATLNLNTGNFARIKIVVPEKTITDAFHKTATPFMEKILSNLKENESLYIIRGSLLPRLMSGKIRLGKN
ncbi:MAG: restriction endonuclease subunit S [Candidatus Omnitrophota bacterium]|nr:restriction endonuclease subunit S [Candidatus Omnitrophota bacterium]